ncbi:unnamed protein product, partial [Adineta steineri]
FISYLSKAQYNIVGSALVRCLRLPSTTENLTIWKDALQTKLKRTRADHPNNSLVQEFRLKYSKLGSGRPVKQKSGTIATRDRHKQVTNNSILLITSFFLLDVIQLQSFSQLDINTQLCLWKETFIFRRQLVRDQSTSDVMKNFPAYSDAVLVFEEVKMLMNIDLSKEEPPTAYPTMVSIDDIIHIYVDFEPILTTSSPDDALDLLIAMYSIFELSFDKKSRTTRFLYCVYTEKNIDIHRERLQLPSISSYSVSNNTTTLTGDYQSQSQIVTNLLNQSTGEHNSSVTNETTEPTASIDSSNSSTDIAYDPNDPQAQKKNKRKQILNEEEQDDTLMNNASQENVESSKSRRALANRTNSTVVPRRTKRQRRT